MTSRYCVFGYYGQGNTGDEAILASLVHGLSNADIAVTVYSEQPVLTSRLHKVESHRPFPKTPWTFLKALVRSNRMRTLRAVWCFVRADVVVIGGGGLFFDTPETNRWFNEYISLIRLAKWIGKKVAVVGVSVGPLHHLNSEEGLRTTFGQCEFISVRDDLSRDILVSCGIDKDQINVIPDLVFALTPCKESRAKEILISEIGLVPENLIVLAPCAYNMGVQGWLESYTSLVNELVLTYERIVLLVPMQCVGGLDDRFAIRKILDGIDDAARGSAYSISENYSPREIQGIFSLAMFVFSERLHGTIMAANTKRPFLSLVYMPKVSGVLAMLGVPHAGVSMSEFCGENYGEALAKSIHGLNAPSADSHQINAVQERASLNLEHLIRLQCS